MFGGLLDRCTLGPFIKRKRKQSQIIDGLTYFTAVSNINDLNTITSGPVQVCFCNNSQPDCGYQLPPIQVKKGELFTVPLVAVDHAKQVISATIFSSLKRNESGIGEGQLMQSTGKNCTDLTYNVYSKHDSEELVVYANGPCKDAELSRGRIQVIFSDCNCPVAFQPNPTELTRCVCECDSKLDKYITDCDSTTKTFTRNGKFWISHINTTDSMVDYQYLIYPYCPLDYCQPSSTNIKVNLDTPDGADMQCANGRSGLLCGTCKPGLTLSLGSSHCIACPSYWSALLTTILASFFLMGIGLVFLIFALNLTVAVGTLNGIIFYVNIINANSSTFLIFKKPNIVSIFISLLNLELGVDVCLFKGMDAYWKTLLQLAFPVYLIFLVVMIIIVSERSTKFARLLGKRNPVATLGTLILLSYAKLLHLIIASLSFAVLHYPNNSYEVVWLPDATVGYLRGKHVILFLTALLILLAGIAYTVLLFSWQWLLRVQNKKLLRWVRYQRLYMFLEPYHAPYTFKHRYWTGLLLLIRAMLYIISAANVSSDPAVNLLAIGIAMIGLLLLKGYSQGSRIYKNWPLDLLEMANYINLAILSLVNLFSLEGNRNQTVSVYISGSFALALFVFILAYHIFQEFLCKTRLWKALKQKRHKVHQEVREEHEIELIQPVVTHTEVTGPKRNETSLSASVGTTEGHYKIEGLHTCSEPVHAPEVHPKMSLPYRLMKSK